MRVLIVGHSIVIENSRARIVLEDHLQASACWSRAIEIGRVLNCDVYNVTQEEKSRKLNLLDAVN